MAGLEGQTFAGHEVLKKLGQGGMGTVYKAHDINLDRLVALKTLSNEFAQDPEFIARFRREASLAAKLDHPNLIRVFTAGEFEGTHYITMELVEGESARDRLAREGRLPLTEVLAIGVFVAEALDHGWQQAKLIHRDIKPANIFLSNTGQVKLGDLGLAKSASETTCGLTTTGQAVGTPFYISPEQGRGQKEIDFRADIYSLGCTLYHLITGEPPYGIGDSMAIIHKHIYDPPPGILNTMPDCPMPVVFLLGKMMAKQPHARQQSYTELIAEMRRAHYQLLEPVAPPRPATSPRIVSAARQSHALIYYVVAAALITIGVGLWIWEPWKADYNAPRAAITRGSTETQRQIPPPAATSATQQSTSRATRPTADAFIAEISALPAEQQLQRVLAKLQELNPGFDGQAAPKIEDGQVIELKFSSANVTDLSPLRALTGLRQLGCRGSKDSQTLANLEPLRGLQLEALDCAYSQVSDLSPLAEMPLQELCCAVSRVSDLSPLKNIPLFRLDIYHTPVCELSPVAHGALRWLNCKGTTVQDLAPLRDTALEELHCDAALLPQHVALLRGISSLKIVNAKSLEELPASTPSPSAVPATTTAPSSTPAVPFPSAVAAASPEQQLASIIARLRQSNPGFDGRETHKIKDGAVTELAFSTVAVRDLMPLRDLRGLKRLLLSPWPGQTSKGVLSDLNPLKNLLLKTLNCANTQVSDLLPLYRMPLEVLLCNNTAVSDLLALEGMPLTLLNCSGTPVSDLSPLGALPLKELVCDFVPERDAVLLRGFKTLEKINGLPAPAFWMRLDAVQPARPKFNSSATAVKPAPVDDAFVRFVAVLPPEKQVVRVMDKLKNLNRGFAGEETHAIENGKVTRFSLAVTAGLSDLSPLRAFAGLRSIECTINAAEFPPLDLRPLHGLPLVELKLRHVTVNDLKPLNGMQLEMLNLDSCRLPELSALQGIPLKRLSLWFSTVADLAPVAAMSLEFLNCSGTKIRDLSPLKGMPLKDLFCDETAVSDLSPVAQAPLRTLRCTPSVARAHARMLASIQSLARINDQSAAEFLAGATDPK